MKRFLWALCALLVLAGHVTPSSAAEYTDVIDAFDWKIGDAFDANLILGYERMYKKAIIRRETFDTSVSTPDRLDYYNYVSMFRYEQTVHILNTGIDIGLFRDLALQVRLPVILRDSRNLKEHESQQWHDINGDGVNDAADQLWDSNVKSHDRSGLDHISTGLYWGILDQSRKESLPNWVLFVEGRFGVGEEMKASCMHCEVNTKHTGASRGYYELVIGTRLSRRYKFLEPFVGFDGVIAWFKDKAMFDYTFGDSTPLNDNPPLVGHMDFGMEIIPWEQPDHYRKLAIGVGGGASYHSEGRERTPLYDALGTSTYFLKDDNNPDQYVDLNSNGQNDGGNEVAALENWTGMTDVENYSTLYAKLFVMVQMAKYVKFRVGAAWAHETSHFITKTDVCSSTNTSAGGMCANPNLSYRPEIDKPGNRFRQDATFMWNFFVDATAQF